MPDNTLSVAHASHGKVSQKKEVPAFLQKLFKMVDDPQTDALIRWNDTGDTFLVMRHEDFAKELLPRYYKHKHFSSFVRQLNSISIRYIDVKRLTAVYGFHKIPHLEDNTLTKGEIWEFSNPNFHRDQPDLLCLVTRKKSGESVDKDTIDFMSVMKEIQAIKRHQVTISQELKRIQADNQALWQEQADTRARHSKHQDTIEKILAFLGHIYGSQGQEDKSIHPKKRKLLLDSDSSEQVATLTGLARLQDEKAQETFQDMFKSARSDPQTANVPVGQQGYTPSPHSTSRQSEDRFVQEPDSPPEMRFTLPNRRAGANRPASEASDGRSPSLQSPNQQISSQAPTLPPTSLALMASQIRPPSVQDFQQLSEGAALTPSIEKRLKQNEQLSKELEFDISQQDQNIAQLADLLGMDPNTLDLSNMDPALLETITEDPQFSQAEFSQFLEDFPMSGEIQDEASQQDDWLASGTDPTMLPDADGARAPSIGHQSNGSTPRLESITSTPSTTSKDEVIEEVNMRRGR